MIKAFEVTVTVLVIAEDENEALEYVDSECRFMTESSLSDCPSTKGYKLRTHAEYTGGDERIDALLEVINAGRVLDELEAEHE